MICHQKKNYGSRLFLRICFKYDLYQDDLGVRENGSHNKRHQHQSRCDGALFFFNLYLAIQIVASELEWLNAESRTARPQHDDPTHTYCAGR